MKKPTEKPRRRWKYNITTDVQDILYLYRGMTRFISLWVRCSGELCENDNEFSGFIEDEQFLGQPNKLAFQEQLRSTESVIQQTQRLRQILKKTTAACKVFSNPLNLCLSRSLPLIPFYNKY